ncbi:MAG TPA: SdrD B-like domain-containing protein, partial [Saprospiraceae bacterium]|nr:SdrD B-like domain-containing protein [Saprospiraceae bacterium]
LAASEAFQGSDRNKDSHVTHAFGPNSSELLVLSSGQKVYNFHAGFQDKSTVGNFVWLDTNYNGVQDKSEKPVEGVKVMAINAKGVIVSESSTSEDGTYMLDGIAQGDYYIKFIPQKEYQFTKANIGLDTYDSDVNGDQGIGTTALMRVNTGDNLSNVDAGLVLSILSVEWLDFNVVNNGYLNQLTWITSNEINNSHFVIERRLESEKNFREIGIHDASTDLSTNIHYYTYDDYELNFVGNYYYRIKQVDKNGSVNYSKIVTITMNHAEDFNCAIFPNPAQDEIILDLFVMKDGYLEATVFTVDGVRTNLTMDFGFKKAGLYKYNFSLNDFVQGQYILQLRNEENILYKKFAIIR